MLTKQKTLSMSELPDSTEATANRITDHRRIAPAAALIVMACLWLPACAPQSPGPRPQDSATKPADLPPDVLAAIERYRNLVQAGLNEQDVDQALEALEQQLDLERDHLGEESDAVAESLGLKVRILTVIGDFPAATRLRETMLKNARSRFGKEHWRTTDASLDLQHVKRLAQLSDAELDLVDRADELNAQANNFFQQSRPVETVRAARQALALQRRIFGESNRECLRTLSNLVVVCKLSGDFETAESLAKEALPLSERVLGREHPNHAILLDNAAGVYEAQADFARAETLYRSAFEIKKRTLGARAESVARSMNNLGGLYRQTGQLEQAETLLRQAAELFAEVVGPNHPECATAALNLCAVYQVRGDFARAESNCQRAIKILKEAVGENHPDYADALSTLAQINAEQGRLPAAERLLKQAYEIDRRFFPDSHPRHTLSQHNLGTLYAQMGEFSKGESLLRGAVESARKQLGDKHPQYAAYLRDLANLYELTDRHDEALPLVRSAAAIHRELFGERHVEYVKDLQMLALIHQAKDEFDQAETLARKCLELIEQTLGETHLEYARSLTSLAEVYRASGRYEEANKAFVRSRDLVRSAVGESHPDYAVSLHNLAAIAEAMGNYDQAEKLLQEVLQLTKAGLGEDHPDYAASLYQLAFVYQSMGKYAQAESLTVDSLRRIEKAYGRGHSNYARAANNLGALYRELGNYAEAERFFRQAMEIQKEVYGETHTSYLLTLNNLAGLYVMMGDFAGAKLLGGQTLDIAEELSEVAPTRVALIKSNLGLLHWTTGEPQQAFPLISEALQLFGSKSQTNFDYARTLFNLAVVRHALGDSARAEADLLRARALFANLNEAHPNLALCDAQLGRLCLASGRLNEAKTYFEATSRHRLETLGDRHPAYADSLNQRATADLRDGHPERAIPLLREALEIARDNLELAAIVQSRRQQTRMLNLVRRYLDTYLAASVRVGAAAEDAYQPILTWKGAVFERQRSLVRGDPESEKLMADLRSSASQLSALRFAIPNPAQRAAWKRRMQQLVLEREHYEVELARKTGAARDADSRRLVTTRELRDSLPANTVLVDFYEYFDVDSEEQELPSKFVAHVLRRDQPLARVDLGASKVISDAVQSWRRQATRITPQGRAAGNQLRRLIWEPLALFLKDKPRVLVSPDGALNHLPLGALPGVEPGSYLLEAFSISINPSPKLLPAMLRADANERQSSDTGLLLVGNVDFRPPSGVAVSPGSTTSPAQADSESVFRFKPLPGTRREVQQLEELCRQSSRSNKIEVLSGRQATEQAFRSRAADQRIIHLATHGFSSPRRFTSLDDSPFAGRGMKLLADDRGSVSTVELSVLDPGLASGIALAGANQSRQAGFHRRQVIDDGVLTALELADLDLRKTDLAVLSACETGLGELIAGEGLLGVQRAFHVAGADTVIASLWKVDDTATQALMVEFYRHLLRPGIGKYEALRQAQLTMLHRYDPATGKLRPATSNTNDPADSSGSLPPWYWSAFVLSGDWR